MIKLLSLYNIVIRLLSSQFFTFSLYSRSIAGTVVLFIIARYLSIHDFGLFTSYKNISYFILMFTNFGFADYILVSSHSKEKIVKLKVSLFLVNAIFVTFLVAVGSLILKINNHLLFALVTFRVFFDSIFFSLILPCFQAAEKFNLIAKINLIYSVGISIIAFFSYYLKLSLQLFLVLNIVLGTINFIQCSYILKIRYLSVILRIKNYTGLVDKKIFFFIGTTLACFLYSQIPSFYVSTHLKKEQAALFFAAFTISSVVTLIVQAETQKMVPKMIKSSFQQSKAIIQKRLFFLLTITGIIFLLSIFFGKEILLIIYKQEYYVEAYSIMILLMFGNILFAEASIYGSFLTAIGKQKDKMKMQIEASIATVVLLIILNDYGLIGPTLSFISGTFVIAVRYTMYTIVTLKKDSLNTDKNSY